MRVPTAYLASYLLSVLGNSVAAVALPLVILSTTGSALGAGTVAAATAVPALLAGVLMGVVIDRINRRTASVVTDVVSALSVAALPFVDLFTDLDVALFALFGALGAFGDIPGMTARETLLPGVVRLGRLTAERLIGIRESLGAVALVLGPAIAGVLVSTSEGSTVLWVTAGLSGAAAATTLLVPHETGALTPPPAGAEAPRLRGWAELREGWSTIARSRFLVVVLTMTFVAGTVSSSFSGLIMPVYFTRLEQSGQLGLALSTIAVGMLLGSGVYAAVAGRRPGRGRSAWLAAGLVGSTLGFATMATLADLPTLLAGALLAGLAIGLFTSLMGVLILERTPDHVRGRVLGTQNAVLTVAPPLGVMVSAVLTETVALGAAAAVAAGLWAVMTVAVLVARPLRQPAPPDVLLDPEHDAGDVLGARAGRRTVGAP